MSAAPRSGGSSLEEPSALARQQSVLKRDWVVFRDVAVFHREPVFREQRRASSIGIFVCDLENREPKSETNDSNLAARSCQIERAHRDPAASGDWILFVAYERRNFCRRS